MDGLLQLKAQIASADYDYNPYLRNWEQVKPNNLAGKGEIQDPAHAKNIIWQTRSAPPTEAENALGDALEEVLHAGAETLGQVAKGLNERGSSDPQGKPWTEESLAAELHRLGA